MSIICDICRISSDKKHVEFRLVTKTKKLSMCDECYAGYKVFDTHNPAAIRSEHIQKVEKEELSILSKKYPSEKEENG